MFKMKEKEGIIALFVQLYNQIVAFVAQSILYALFEILHSIALYFSIGFSSW